MNKENILKTNYKDTIKQSKKEGATKLKGNAKLFMPIILLRFILFLPLATSFCFLFFAVFNNEFILKPFFREVFYYFSIARESNKYLLITLFAISFFSFYFISLPLKYGIRRWHLKISNTGKSSINEIFFYYGKFKDFFKILLLDATLKIKKLFYFLLCLIPSFFLFIYSSISMQQDIQINHKFMFGIFIILSFILGITSVFLFLILTMKYMFAINFFIENNNTGINCSIKKSCITVKKNRLNIIRFTLSFSLLFLSCIFILPIFYVFPYFGTSLFIYSKKIPIRTNKHLEKISNHTINIKNDIIPSVS